MLSGFVLAPQLLHCVTTRHPADVGVFLARRWMRTVPPYLLALCAITVMTLMVGTQEFVAYATYTQNLFTGPAGYDCFPVAWSLSVEEWAYLVFAFGAVLSVGWKPDPVRKLAAIALAVVCGALRAQAPYGETWGEHVRRVVIFRVDAIALGILLRLAMRLGRWRPRFLGGVLLCGVAAVASMLVALAAADDTIWAQYAFP